MRRPRRTIVLALLVLVLIGTGLGVALRIEADGWRRLAYRETERREYPVLRTLELVRYDGRLGWLPVPRHRVEYRNQRGECVFELSGENPRDLNVSFGFIGADGDWWVTISSPRGTSVELRTDADGVWVPAEDASASVPAPPRLPRVLAPEWSIDSASGSG